MLVTNGNLEQLILLENNKNTNLVLTNTMVRLFFICSLLFLISCEKEIEKTISQDYEADVVVNSIISTDSTFSVQLNYSKSVYDISDFKPVENASIYIAVKDDIDDIRTQDFFLDYQGDGLYTRGNNPIGGRTYEMVIEVDGKIISAETYVPKVLKAEILTESKSSNLNPKTKQMSVSVEIAIEEEENQSDNYYAWDLIPLVESTPTTVNEKPNETDKVVDISNDGTGSNPGGDGSTISVLTKNEGISGAVPALSDESGKITASFEGISETTEETEDSEYGTDPQSTSQSLNTKRYKLKVWSISSDYYYYLLSVQQNGPGNSEATFVGPYSNVTNGYGIFAGYNLQEFELEF